MKLIPYETDLSEGKYYFAYLHVGIYNGCGGFVKYIRPHNQTPETMSMDIVETFGLSWTLKERFKSLTWVGKQFFQHKVSIYELTEDEVLDMILIRNI